MRDVVPGRLCCGVRFVQRVCVGLLRRDVLPVQLRHRRLLRPGDQRHRRVHVRERVHAAVDGCVVRQLQVWLLPERLAVPGLLDELHGVQLWQHVHDVQQPPACAAGRQHVRERVPERLLLGRHRLPCLR